MSLVALVLAASVASPAQGEPRPAPRAEEVVAGVWLIRGAARPPYLPDGNVIVFETPDGAIMFDTGRHAEVAEVAGALIDRRLQPLVAVVNSHWHLDHTSGNLRVEERYPDIPVFSADGLDRDLDHAIRPAAAAAQRRLAEDSLLPELADDLRGDVATLAKIDALRPDVIVEGETLIPGELKLSVERNAVTGADVWLFDPWTRTVAAGDLVTLPAPLFEASCPTGWLSALGRLAEQPLERLIPGHGRVLTSSEFHLYRASMHELFACARSDRPAEICGASWAASVAGLIAPEEAEAARSETARQVSEALRGDIGAGRFC